MKFTPKTEEQLLPPAGEYTFKVIAASDEISKSGNEMIKLRVQCYQQGTAVMQIFDYLLEAMPHKLMHFCRYCGLEERYSTGELTADDCIGRTGLCLVAIQPAGDYPAKNVIKDYLETPSATGDDVPF